MVKEKKDNKNRKWLFWALRFLLTVVALYFVYKKIDFRGFWGYLQQSDLVWLLFSFLAFNVSKSIAALRLNRFYKACGAIMTEFQNWQLYYLGMFYNMFLPGSIGGDAYKVWLLNRHKETKLKHLASATLLDRLSGLVLLVLLTCGLIYGSTFDLPEYSWWVVIPLAGGLLILPIYYFFIKKLFKVFLPAFTSSTILSFFVQIGQLASAYALLIAIGIHDYQMDYLCLFMVSSVAAVLPLTLFGLGARELVFIYGTTYFSVIEEKAVAFTLLFFFITAFSSLFGIVFSWGLKLEQDLEKD